METANVKLTFQQLLLLKDCIVRELADTVTFTTRFDVECLIGAYNKLDRACYKFIKDAKAEEESKEPEKPLDKQ